ncbi:MAG: pyridoxamine 5'-phosphate oxidase family protein [bacterium]|nr:pyridoxamine 5'-phosphate oxidase family protein [bacterium]
MPATTRDYADLPPDHVRRADRQVTDEAWIVELLNRAATGSLATAHEGQPFINTNLFVYDSARHAIYMHTARAGRTRANVEISEKVCFTVTEMGRLLPAEEALEFSVEYSGVVAFGSACIVDQPAEQRYGLQLLMDKYFPHLKPGDDYRPIADEELVRTSVYRIDITTWTGKRKQVEDDFPGAFFYPVQR